LVCKSSCFDSEFSCGYAPRVEEEDPMPPGGEYAVVFMVLMFGGAVVAFVATIIQENNKFRQAERQRQKPLTPEQMADKEFWYRAQARMLDAEGEYKLKTAELQDIEQFLASRRKLEKTNAK
jgi:uncharacterized Rmd1/YagE family protein